MASQDTDSEFYGRVCVNSDIFYYTKKDMNDGTKPFNSAIENTMWGNVFVFANRLSTL